MANVILDEIFSVLIPKEAKPKDILAVGKVWSFVPAVPEYLEEWKDSRIKLTAPDTLLALTSDIVPTLSAHLRAIEGKSIESMIVQDIENLINRLKSLNPNIDSDIVERETRILCANYLYKYFSDCDREVLRVIWLEFVSSVRNEYEAKRKDFFASSFQEKPTLIEDGQKISR